MSSASRLATLVVFMSVVTLTVTHSARADGTATAPAAGLYERIVAQYFAGNWDELSAELTTNAKEALALPPARKADVDYIRKTIAESRPAWWKVVKADAPVKFRPVVWGKPITGSFNPQTKQNVHINFVGGAASVVFHWNAKEMDDPTVVGELKFTKGEQTDLDIWENLGYGGSWTDVPPRSQINMTEEARQQLSRYLDYRGNLAGAYYTTPRARRLSIWQSISSWSHEYDKVPPMYPHRTVGVLFVEEVLAHPEVYTTVPRPKEPPADGAESKLIWELQEWIRHHDLSLVEEKSFREALKALAAVNEIKVRATGRVLLPNGQAFSIEPVADKPLAVQRDAWIKAQYAKPPAHSK